VVPYEGHDDCNDVDNNISFEVPKDYRKDWTLIPIRIPDTERASLGIAIIRDTFPNTKSTGGKPHCIVKRVFRPQEATSTTNQGGRSTTKTVKKCIGIKYGLQPGDWFLRPGEEYDRQSQSLPIFLASFEDVQVWSKRRPYKPICLLRQKQKQGLIKSSPEPKISETDKFAAHKETLQTTAQKPRSKPSTAVASERQSGKQGGGGTEKTAKKKKNIVDKPKGNGNDDGDIVPFCNLCNAQKNNNKKKMPRLHHAWCPKNHFFSNSGADDIMNRIMHGRKLNCPACHLEYRTGKPVVTSNSKTTNSNNGKACSIPQHNHACQKNQERLKKEQEKLERKEEERDQQLEARKKKKERDKKKETHQPLRNRGAAKNGGTRKNKGSRSENKGEKRMIEWEMPSSCSSSSEEEGDDVNDDSSMYEPTKKRARIQTWGLAETPSSIPKGHKTNQSRPLMNNSAQSTSRHRDLSRLSLKSRSKQTVRMLNSPRGHVNSRWIAFYDDPWGEDGHLIGDVLLFGPQRGYGHFEVLMPSNRYKTDPFETGSRYRITHFAPEEGLSLISLKRDSLGKVPWGFQVTRDEFDHACLVDSVDYDSPASAAAWIGSQSGTSASRFRLSVNDMLVMINGKPVGGMTEVGLNLELEMSAPYLYLAVSRYKHTAEASVKQAERERRKIELIDATAQDERLIGWQEIGNRMDLSVQANETISQNVDDTRTEKGDIDDSRTPILQVSIGRHRDVPTEKDLESSKCSNVCTEKQHMKSSDAAQHKQYSKSAVENRRDRSLETPYGGPIGDSAQRSQRNASDSDSDDLEDDPNPWLGCICGEIHSSQDRRGDEMFWIQCEQCKSWYDVAEKCVGFTEVEAATICKWICEGCVPIDSNDEEDLSAAERTAGGTAFQGQTSQNGQSPAELGISMVETYMGSRLESEPTSVEESGQTHARAEPHAKKLSSPSEEEAPIAFNSLAAAAKASPSIVKKLPLSNPSRRASDAYLLPTKELIQQADGTFAKPLGPAPRDLVWDEIRGLWAPPLTNTKGAKRVDARKQSLSGKVAQERFKKRSKRQESQAEKRFHFTRGRGNRKKDDESGHIRNKDGFKEGDLVDVKPHAWPGVNNNGGIGYIVAMTVDEDGDRLYDVKYVAANFKEKEILEQFINLHCFD
jgi:hypothetical protein